MKKIIMLLCAVMCLILGSSTYAMNSVSLFGGNNYILGNKNAWTLEFLYFGHWKYGDNLYFFEVTNPHRDTTSIVGDWYSRLSLSKITGHPIKFGPISDLSASTALAVSGLNSRVYGLGGGIDWAIPHFTNMITNVYWSHDDKQHAATYQIVTVWTMPMKLSDRFHLVFGGYGQFTGAVGQLKRNLMLEPSLMLDVGNLFHLSSKKVFAGLQFAYWHNAFGLAGQTEHVPEIKFTWAF
jgi:nucleoside-specific outer membrane channel protein Tsx